MQRGDVPDYYTHNLRLHWAIVDAARNDKVREVYRQGGQQLHVVRLRNLSGETGLPALVAEHRAIVAAIRDPRGRRRPLRATRRAARRIGPRSAALAGLARRLYADGGLRRHARHQPGAAQAAVRHAVADFTPIAMVGGTPNVLVVHPSLEAKNLAEFIRLVKSQPGRMNYGTAGPGTLTHLVMEQFKEATQTFLVHVPYRGIAPALTDLLANQTQASFPGLAAALPQIRTGKLRPLAVTGLARHRLLPEVPTLEESGLKGFVGVQWYGIVGPAKLPPAFVGRLNTEINAQLAMPELRERLSGEALEPMPMTPDAFAKYIGDDIAKWSRLVKARRIEID